jgi:hypothetical protein
MFDQEDSMLRMAWIAVVIGLTVTGCGSTKGERATTGAGLGAAGGAVIGAITGLSVVEGALIGAGVGGVTGLLTDQDDINLGKPVWEWGDESSSSSAQAAPTQTQTAAVNSSGSVVREVQSSLSRLGYDPGPIDGAMGPKTATAIRSYQQQNGLLVDGRASQPLAEHLRQKLGGG